jgi:predicted RNase H-like HicB family nuclease
MIPVRHKEQTYSLTVDQHEDGYFGYFAALPGCRAWGATYDTAVRASQDVLIRYLDTPDQCSDPIPGETKEPVLLGARILAAGLTLRTIHLHRATTATAMVTCIAIILFGPLVRTPRTNALPPGHAAIGAALPQPNESRSPPQLKIHTGNVPQASESTVETEHIPFQPTSASKPPPSSIVAVLVPAVAALGDGLKDGTDDAGGKETPRGPALADQPVQPRANDDRTSEVVNREIITGIWSPEGSTCSARDFQRGVLPTVISADGAWAGDTFCIFRKKLQTETGWRIVAECSSPRERWMSSVRLTVSHDRLLWTSQRGTQAYARCAPEVLMAQAR